jgi:hypothetical protein
MVSRVGTRRWQRQAGLARGLRHADRAPPVRFGQIESGGDQGLVESVIVHEADLGAVVHCG